MDYGGRFTLEERIGRGGMAEVWKATMSGKSVALKRILPALARDRDFVRMFEEEAKICARLHHPNIVEVFDFGRHGDECFLAMEYVRGRNLNEIVKGFLRKEQRPPPGIGATVVYELCRALGYAHGLAGADGRPLGLVHRDVSPGNVMVSVDGGVKLVDFGIAKLVAEETERTRTGVVKGKLPYMAPERLAQKPSDHRADLFSAGVVLYEVLSGRRLFSAAGEDRARALVERLAELVPPSRYNAEVPPELDRICARALAPDAAARFQSAGEMAAALEPVVARLGWTAERLAATVLEQLTPKAETQKEVPTVKQAAKARWPAALGALLLVVAVALAARWPHAVPRTPAPPTPTPQLQAPEPPAPPTPASPPSVQPPPQAAKNKRRRPPRSRPTRDPLDARELASPF